MRAILLGMMQVILASGILYGYYHIALRNKKFHQYNRFYLLAAVTISLLIPFLNIPVYFAEKEIQSSLVLQTLQTISTDNYEPDPSAAAVIPEASHPFNRNIIVYLLYAFAAGLLLIRVLVSLNKIRSIIKNNPAENLNEIHFINTAEPGTPFSFFRWLFWNRNIELSSEKGEQIFRHEVFHIQQRHSVDVIVMELVSVIFWINPFYHLVKKELKAIHEFLADQFAAHQTEKWEYAELLLMQALNTQQHLVNPFFHNQIKRRIAMITNPKKTSHRYLRKLLVLPVTAMVVALFAFSYKQQTTNSQVHNPGKPITIVIDAAHGGTDNGVLSPDKKYSEAHIALEIAMQIRELAKEYGVNVVMTREDDKFPGNATNKEEGLKQRIQIANTSRPDAFIAIHVNVTTNALTGDQQSYSGFEAYVSDKREDTKGRLLATTILKNLSPIYKTSLQLKQRKESGIYVLDHNSYPAVLLECGYINNSDDRAFITDKTNQQKVARSILDAIISYRNSAIHSGETSSADEGGNSRRITGTVEIAQLDSTNFKAPSKIKLNGKPFSVKEVKIEGMENAKIVAADFHLSPATSPKDTTDPLIVVDGVKQENNSTLANIDPASIESINVLKGKTATAKYGNGAKNGVIEIFTKKNPNRKTEELIVQERPLESDKSQEAAVREIWLPEIVLVGYASADLKQPIASPGKVPALSLTAAGSAEWRKFLERNLDPYAPISEGWSAGTYKILIQFSQNEDGTISEIKALTYRDSKTAKHCIDILTHIQKMLPQKNSDGGPKAYFVQPLTFQVIAGKTVS